MPQRCQVIQWNDNCLWLLDRGEPVAKRRMVFEHRTGGAAGLAISPNLGNTVSSFRITWHRWYPLPPYSGMRNMPKELVAIAFTDTGAARLRRCAARGAPSSDSDEFASPKRIELWFFWRGTGGQPAVRHGARRGDADRGGGAGTPVPAGARQHGDRRRHRDRCGVTRTGSAMGFGLSADQGDADRRRDARRSDAGGAWRRSGGLPRPGGDGAGDARCVDQARRPRRGVRDGGDWVDRDPVRRQGGADLVIAVDPIAHRREVALALGADAALDPVAEGDTGLAIRRMTGWRGVVWSRLDQKSTRAPVSGGRCRCTSATGPATELYVTPAREVSSARSSKKRPALRSSSGRWAGVSGCRARSFWRICGVGPARAPVTSADESVSRESAAMTSASDREIGLVCRAAFFLPARSFLNCRRVVKCEGICPIWLAPRSIRASRSAGAGALGSVRWLDRIGALLRDRVWPGESS